MTTIKVDVVRARIDPQIKESAEKVLEQLGMTMSDAIRFFLTQVSLRQAFPVELSLPETTTVKAATPDTAHHTKKAKD